MADAPADVTALLDDVRAHAPAARDRLLAAVATDLRRQARAILGGQPAGQCQPTSLLNEVLWKLYRWSELGGVADRRALLAVTARTMRNALADRAKWRTRQKRGGHARAEPLDVILDHFAARSADMLVLHDALEALARDDERAARVAELRLFGNLTRPEIAAALGVAVATVEADWRLARAWLHRQWTQGEEQ